MKKSTYSFIFLLFVSLFWCKNNYAQLPINSWNSIPLVDNIDSLEEVKAIVFNDKAKLIDLIIVLEHSRNRQGSIYFSKYISDLEKLNSVFNRPFVTAFIHYMKARVVIFRKKGNLIVAGKEIDKSIQIFRKLNDSLALLNSLLVKSSILYEVESSLKTPVFVGANFDYKEFRKTLELNEIIRVFNLARKYIQYNNGESVLLYNMYFSKFLYSTFTNDSTLVSIRKMSKASIDLAKKSAQLNPYKAYFTTLDLISVPDNEIDDDLIEKYIKTNNANSNKESINYSITNLNAGKYYLDKGDYKRSYSYLKKVEDFYLESKFFNSKNYELCLKYLALLYKKTSKVKESLEYTEVYYLEQSKNKSLSEASNFYIYQNKLLLQKKEFEKKEIEIKNKNTKKLLFFSLISFSIILVSLIFVLKSRTKLKSAFDVITKLQKSKDKLMAIISHDLKSPMDSYQGLANSIGYLIKKRDYDKLEKIAFKIDENGQKLSLLLHNLFHWSISQEQNIGIHKEMLSFDKMVQDNLDIYFEIAQNKDIVFETNLNCKSPFLADANHLSTVIRNLIDNSIKHSPPFSTILIDTLIDGKNAQFTISNPGNISSEKLNLINEFFLFKSEAHPGENGFGFGLILIREYCKNLNAEIKLSQKNTYLVFEINIPV